MNSESGLHCDYEGQVCGSIRTCTTCSKSACHCLDGWSCVLGTDFGYELNRTFKEDHGAQSGGREQNGGEETFRVESGEGSQVEGVDEHFKAQSGEQAKTDRTPASRAIGQGAAHQTGFCCVDRTEAHGGTVGDAADSGSI